MNREDKTSISAAIGVALLLLLAVAALSQLLKEMG